MSKRKERKSTTPPPSLPMISCDVPGCESIVRLPRSWLWQTGWPELTAKFDKPKAKIIGKQTNICPDTHMNSAGIDLGFH